MTRTPRRETGLTLLGIDFGRRRIGLAASDADQRVALPQGAVVRPRGKRPPYGPIRELAERLGVEAVVLGLPLSLDGEETDWCAEVRRFGSALEHRLQVPVHYQDERMTSARAQRGIRASGLPRSKRAQKERVDESAAALILQAWMDSR